MPIRPHLGAAGDFVESGAGLARLVTLPCSSSGLSKGGVFAMVGIGVLAALLSALALPLLDAATWHDAVRFE